MRAPLVFLVASISACVGIAAACSSFSGETGAGDGGDVGEAGDAAGADGNAADAATIDAAGDVRRLPATPGQIECFGATCSSATSQSCCFDTDAGTTQCASSCASGLVPIECDEKTDCAPGRVCCVGLFGNADCQPTCTGERLCHTDDECDVGSSCVVLPCRGSVIGACGPVGPYVKAFCDPPRDH